jgi:hypothetical protein
MSLRQVGQESEGSTTLAHLIAQNYNKKEAQSARMAAYLVGIDDARYAHSAASAEAFFCAMFFKMLLLARSWLDRIAFQAEH